jgi:hypothetical protein
MKEGRPDSSFQIYQVRHPRGACYERRSSRRLPSKFIKSDTHVVHVMKEGRPEDFLPNLSSQTSTWCSDMKEGRQEDFLPNLSI